MPKYTLPAYAIVELLIRLSHHYKQIGDYKNHKVYEDHALVKTTGGSICFRAELVMQQFNDPALVSHEALAEAVVSSFKPLRVSAKTI